MSSNTITIYTIGFCKKDAETFFRKLHEAGVRRVADVRLRNTSQMSGFTKRDDLRYFLKRITRIDYVHHPELGPTEALLAAYRPAPKEKRKAISWAAYEHRFNEIIVKRQIENLVTPEQLRDACLLCSEPEPDKCHRRLVAEYLQRQWGNVRIAHIL